MWIQDNAVAGLILFGVLMLAAKMEGKLALLFWKYWSDGSRRERGGLAPPDPAIPIEHHKGCRYYEAKPGD